LEVKAVAFLAERRFLQRLPDAFEIEGEPVDVNARLLRRGRRRETEKENYRAELVHSQLSIRNSSLIIFPLFVPSHLDRFELRFVRRFGVVGETVEFHHLLTQIDEPDRERVGIRILLVQRNTDVLGARPFHGRISFDVSASSAALSDFPSWMPPPSC